GLLAIAVFFASFVIIVLALSGVAVELRDRRRAELETDRMRGLANAAVVGLLVCDGEQIVTVNDSFATLVGASTDQVVGTALAQYLPDDDTRAQLFAGDHTSIEGELLKADGSRNPVELIQRPVDFAGKAHRAIAVRDLQARKNAEQHIRFLAHHDAL